MARVHPSGTDWSLTQSTACATVTSFGSSSASGAKAVCQCSLPASHTTVNKDYDHIMQMTVPSVHSSLVLARTFSLCSDSYLSPRGDMTVQPCVDKAEGDRKSCSDKYAGIYHIVSGAKSMKWAFRDELKQPANKSLDMEMFTGWDLQFFGGFGSDLFPMKVNLAAAYNYIFVSDVLPILCEHFAIVAFQFNMTMPPCPKPGP